MELLKFRRFFCGSVYTEKKKKKGKKIVKEEKAPS